MITQIRHYISLSKVENAFLWSESIMEDAWQKFVDEPWVKELALHVKSQYVN